MLRNTQVVLHEWPGFLRQLQKVRFAMREMTWKKARFLLLIWLLSTIATAMTGPFGTYVAMPLSERLPYWGLVAAGSILLSEYVEGLVIRGIVPRRPLPLLALGLAYVLVLSGLINLLNVALYPNWPFVYGWGMLLVFVSIVTVLILLAMWLATPRWLAGDESDPEAAFLKRLKPAHRAPLLRVESQDHYLLVVTQAGQELILMRLADALRELAKAEGLQVHRSHWVARRAIAELRRADGKMSLLLKDGSEVPVSRANQAAVRALEIG